MTKEFPNFQTSTLSIKFSNVASPLAGVQTITHLKHGGDIDRFAQEARKDKEGICDFSSNINPLGISSAVEKTYRESLFCILEYPDSYARALCGQVADHFCLAPDQVIVGNGAISLIDLTIRAFRPKRALLVEPCFNEYRRLLNLYGAQVRQIFLKEGDAFNFSYRDILRELDGIDMIILGYPNNPTGTALQREEMISLIKEAARRKIFLLIDEAFVDWNPHLSIYQEIKESPFVVVIRSLTKFFALAGIRAGFALAQPHVIVRMRAVQEPWSCNGLAQRLSIAALQDIEFQRKSLIWFREESKHFYPLLIQFPELKVFPSLANFFLMKLDDKEDEKVFWNFMKSQGIYLRDMNDIVGLNNRYFRVALKDRRQNSILIDKLKEVFAKEQCLSS